MSTYYNIGKVYQDGEVLPAADLNTDKTAIDTAFTNLEAAIVSPAEANFKSQFRRNDIINGRFLVWNEGWTSSHSATQNPADGDPLAEMWFMDRSYTGGTVEVVLHNISGGNFDYGQRLNSLTQASPGTNDYVAMTYRMEGITLSDYQNKTGTLVFSALAVPAGTYSVVFTNGVDRWYVAPFTVATASAWADYYIPFPFSTAGGTWNYDDTTGLYIHFVVGAGSGVQTGSTSTWLTSSAWAASGQADLLNDASGRLILQNVWMIPNVATSSTEYEPPRDGRTVTEIQMLTQRYYEKSYGLDVAVPPSGTPTAQVGEHWTMGMDSTAAWSNETFSTEKRAIPTVTIISAGTGTTGMMAENQGGGGDVAATTSTISTRSFRVSGAVSSPSTLGRYFWTSNARLS